MPYASDVPLPSSSTPVPGDLSEFCHMLAADRVRILDAGVDHRDDDAGGCRG
jgi:hypothetical protein